MLRAYSFPARYRRHIMAALQLAIAEAARDAACRADAVRSRNRTVPDDLYEPEAVGRISIVFDDTDQMPAGPSQPWHEHYRRVMAPATPRVPT